MVDNNERATRRMESGAKKVSQNRKKTLKKPAAGTAKIEKNPKKLASGIAKIEKKL